jgi:hypothetical protein
MGNSCTSTPIPVGMVVDEDVKKDESTAVVDYIIQTPEMAAKERLARVRKQQADKKREDEQRAEEWRIFYAAEKERRVKEIHKRAMVEFHEWNNDPKTESFQIILCPCKWTPSYVMEDEIELAAGRIQTDLGKCFWVRCEKKRWDDIRLIIGIHELNCDLS